MSSLRQNRKIVVCLFLGTLFVVDKTKKGLLIMLRKDITGKKALIYCRVSSKSQTEGTSLDEQEKLCLEFAKQYQLKVMKIYKEDASAMKPNRRKMFNEMVEKFRKGYADVVIFAFVDRMARNAVDGYSILQLVEEEGLTAIFVQERLYLQAPILSNEMLQLDTVLGVSNYRVRLDREKCKAGIKARAIGGFRPCRPPYGYANSGPRDKRHTVISKKRAEFVQKAFDLYATGNFSVAEVAEELYEQGFRYELQPSKVVPKQSLFSILKNPFYTGKYEVKQIEDTVEGRHKAIISDELFEQVQKQLELSPKSPRKHDLLYSKILTCSNCGHFMTGDVKEKTNGKRYVYYRCSNSKCNEPFSVNEVVIDDDLSAYLKEIRLGLIPDEIVKEVLKDELYALTQKLAILKRNVSSKYQAEKRFRDEIAEKDIVDEQYIRGRLAEIEEKYGDLDAKIYLAEKQLEMIRNRTAESLQKRLFDVYVGFDTKTKRKVLDLVANCFKCTEKGLKMTFWSAFRKIRRR